MLLFAQGPVRETQPVYLRPETFFTVAVLAGLAYWVLVAAVKVIQHR